MKLSAAYIIGYATAWKGKHFRNTSLFLHEYSLEPMNVDSVLFLIACEKCH